jgi:thiamine biosynthesis protein ThiI
MDCVICRYGELALKGKNRGLFESKLVSNIQACLKRNGVSGKVTKIYGRMFVFTEDKKALSCLKYVFGLVSISPASSVECDVEKIKVKVLDYVRDLKLDRGKSFRITATRTNHSFPKKSQEMAVILGDAVVDEFSMKVDLHTPDLNVGVEIHDKAFIFHEKVECFGGLPLGITGRVVCLVEKERDLAAAWLMMKRGCSVFPVAFKDIDVSLLGRFSYGQELSLHKIASFEDAAKIASESRCKALVVGDLLEDFAPEKYASAGLPVLAPLVGQTDAEVSSLLARIR